MSTLTNVLAWSNSRINTLEFCERRYFYHYYEAWDGWNEWADELQQFAYMLKNRTNVYNWVGDHTHRAISRCLLAGSSQTLPAIRREIENQMAEEFSFSAQRMKQFRESSSKRFGRLGKQFGLAEHFHGQDLTEEDLGASIELVMDNLDAFLESHYFQMIHEAICSGKNFGLDDGKADFTKMKFELDKITIYAQPDAWIEMAPGQYLIIDWKTGKTDRIGEAELTPQLMIYGLKLLMENRLSLDSTRIEAYEVYIPSLSQRGRALNRDHFDQIQDRIRQDMARMSQYLSDPAHNIPKSIHHFPPTESEKKCESCNFKTLCHRN